MTRKVELGAPSLTGKDANDLVAKEFGKAKFPMKVKVTNQMPRDVAFPVLSGLYLQHCAGAVGTEATVEVKSLDILQRFASDVAQICELNSYEIGLTVTEAAVDEPKKAVEAKAPKAEAVSAVGDKTDAINKS